MEQEQDLRVEQVAKTSTEIDELLSQPDMEDMWRGDLIFLKSITEQIESGDRDLLLNGDAKGDLATGTTKLWAGTYWTTSIEENPALLENYKKIVAVKKKISEQLSNIGIKPICPLSREEFDRTKHVCSERDMIWISEDQENRNETIHSVVKPGILDVNSSKVVKPAYVRKYVFHSGAGNIQAKSPKSETPHKVTDTSADDELRAAAE